MTAVKGTRTPDGERRGHSGPPPVARYPALRIWPGITAGWNARCSCCWAPHDGTYQVKYADPACGVYQHRRAGR